MPTEGVAGGAQVGDGWLREDGLPQGGD